MAVILSVFPNKAEILLSQVQYHTSDSHPCQVNITPLTILLNFLTQDFSTDFDLLRLIIIFLVSQRPFTSIRLTSNEKKFTIIEGDKKKSVAFIYIQAYESDTKRSLIQ